MARLPIVHHPAYTASSMPPRHRFPMNKYQALAQQLIEGGLVAEMAAFHRPIPAPRAWLEMGHDAAYVAAVLDGRLSEADQRKIGFKINDAIALRSRMSASGTLLAGRLALEFGVAANTAGGSHHADRGEGAGFCVFNDVGVAASMLLAEGAVSQILVLDLDVHQGDGTARIFANEPRVFTASIHCEQNWPRRKAASDLDIGLERETGDDGYLAVLAETLPDLIERVKPDLVFYNAGVDPHTDDRLGLLCLSDEGLTARETYVARTVMDAGIALCGVLGGGYGDDPSQIAARHSVMFDAFAREMPS